MDHRDFFTRLADAVAQRVGTTPEPAQPANRDDSRCPEQTDTEAPHFPTSRRDGAAFGEAVADAWYSCGSDRLDIPLGVVAALALHPAKSPNAAHASGLANLIAAQPAHTLVKNYARIYAATWLARPDLMDVATTILRWTEEDLSEDEMRGVSAATQAALRFGVLQHTGDSNPSGRANIDLLSWTITHLRHHSSRKGLGEYHTPPDVTALMAPLLLDHSATSPEPGHVFNEPTAGTGGMFRSIAQDLRGRGLDPHAYGWVMQELNPTAAACAAVNAVIWDLGPEAVVVVGDILSEGNLGQEALAHQREMHDFRNTMHDLAAFALAIDTTRRLVDALFPDGEGPKGEA
ncbi:N-6 DNA methylase [Streptomyces globisporus]|uniref:N-6 DNA methylase n=1 Tax=Streptomyces globisporus TaxID=1908 RepID=UPI0036DDA8AD